MTALSLTAVLGTEGQTGIASTADHLVAVGLTGQSGEGGLNNTTTKTENQVESRLLLDVVVRKGATVLELLTGEDETLLIRGDTYRARRRAERKKVIEFLLASSLAPMTKLTDR